MLIRTSLFILGLASGALLIVAVYLLIGATTSPTPVAAAKPPPPPPTMIAVAAKDIPTGTLIGLTDLKFAAVSAGHLTAPDFVRPVAASPGEQTNADRRLLAEISGAVSRARFNEGDPIIRNMIVKPGDSGFLAAVLRPHMRAVTMSINVVTGAAGLVIPGDHVDVILTQVFRGHDLDAGRGSVAETIANDLRVIAVDQRLQAGGELPKDGKVAQTVTLEVTPLQAEKINLATKMGDLALAIRGVRSDDASGDEDGPTAMSGVPRPVWAKDLSPELTVGGPPSRSRRADGRQGETGAGKPQLSVYRGDKVDNIALP